jgi:uncharacterized protein (TIGR02687 family)
LINTEEIVIKLYQKYRIVIWYDEKGEFASDLWLMDLPGITKLVIDNNEFGIKHQILINDPKGKYLLYKLGPKPPVTENWLADILLSNTELQIDQSSLWLTDLDLGREFIEITTQYIEFFKNSKRTEALKKLLASEDTKNRIKLKMLAICAGSDARWDDIVMNLLSEEALGKSEKYNLINKSGLDVFFWEQVRKLLGYDISKPSIKDFAIEVFNTAFNTALNEKATLDSEVIYLLKRWKDHTQHKKAFREFSANCAEWLGIEQKISAKKIRELIDIDYFELVERKILSDLNQAILSGTITAGEAEQVIRQRSMSHWFEDFRDEYACLESAVQFFSMIKTTEIRIDTFDDGLEKYKSNLHKLDMYYRKFIYHYQQANQPTLLNQLYEELENHYLNKYLNKLNTQFSASIGKIKQWNSSVIARQDRFWEQNIDVYQKNNKKIFVIISDGLRYEIANELMSLIRQEDRYEADIVPMLGMLPSYTQLGMAALLPNDKISVAEDASGTVLVDGQNSSGKDNRAKILDSKVPGKALLMKIDEVLVKSSEDSKKLYRDYDVIYIYQNRIDAVGDKQVTESKVFQEVEATMNELIDAIHRLTSGNANNIIITADHGFLYQHRELDNTDFMSETDVSGDIMYKDRRFIIGKALKSESNLLHFDAKQLGLEGSMEVMIPMANQRMRLSGSGSRYVHGGASLQEIMIPVLKINKKRVSDVEFVDVDLISTGGRIISTGQLVINLYQKEPVSDKMQPVTLRIGVYNQQDELISEEKTIPFDYTSDSPRDREITCKLLLSQKAEKANNQDIILKLEKPIPGTNKFQIYKTENYTLRRSFTSDFDF